MIEKIFIVALTAAFTCVGSLVLVGIKRLMNGQQQIADDAKAGRKIIHDKIDLMKTEFYSQVGETWRKIGIQKDTLEEKITKQKEKLDNLLGQHQINHGGK